MNRSIFFSTFALALSAVPTAALLASESPAPERAASAPDGGRPNDAPQSESARRLSPEECKALREQVRLAAEEHKDGGEAPPVKGDAEP